MKKLSDKIIVGLLPLLASVLLRLLRLTCRLKIVGTPELGPNGRMIFAFWHGRLLMMPFIKPVGPCAVMVSRHRDGELIARTVKRFGIDSSRGSTTRGGMSALKDIINLARRGYYLAFTPDGPKGPKFVAQMGIIQAAKATGLPIYPVSYSARKKKLFTPGMAL